MSFYEGHCPLDYFYMRSNDCLGYRGYICNLDWLHNLNISKIMQTYFGNAFWFSVFGVSKRFLNFLKKFSADYRFVNIFMNLPIFTGIIYSALKFKVFAVSLEIDNNIYVGLAC